VSKNRSNKEIQAENKRLLAVVDEVRKICEDRRNAYGTSLGEKVIAALTGHGAADGAS
jgi:hypothetical protein